MQNTLHKNQYKGSNMITRNQFIVISLMLFSMFFGAGNFIFPTMLGMESGKIFYQTILYFCATAVLLPILGIAAVARCGSVQDLTGRVDKYFGPIFIVLIYLSIGPFLAIPRAGTLPFEVIATGIEDKTIPLIGWTIFFFLINYLISVSRSKAVDILGKWLTPVLLIMIALLIGAVFFIDTSSGFLAPSGKYASAPASSAFLAGYDTMDAMASIVFGIVVINALKDFGIKDTNTIIRITIKTGIFAGVLLSIIYIGLAYLGAAMAGMVGEVSNGADILSKASEYLFGKSGQIILGVALFLACITTTVGLTISGAEYFNALCPKISYNFWTLLFSVISALLANMGLDGILKFGIPILVTFYPVMIVLILLALIDKFIDSSKMIYRTCVYITIVTSLIYSLGTVAKILPQALVNGVKGYLPLYDYGLGWVLITLLAFVITFIIHKKQIKNKINLNK